MKPRVVLHLILMVVGLSILSACKPKVPSQYIQPDEMEDLLYDYYVAQGMPTGTSSREDIDYGHQYNTDLVLKKYGRTRAELDSSMKYYYINMEELRRIYGNVQKRLSNQALVLGASLVEVERFTTQSLSGDTADVWEGSRQMVVFPHPPYNVVQFTQKADSSYHEGDSFLMTCNSTFLAQSGSKNATLVLTICYEGDSIVTHHINISPSGVTTLRVPACHLKAKELKGFVYMPKRPPFAAEGDMCVLMVDHIQLVRFHHEISKPQVKLQNPDSLKRTQDSLRRDSLKPDTMPRRHKLGERPQSAKPEKIENNKQQIKPIIKI